MRYQANMLLTMLDGVNPWTWLIIGVALLVLEMLTGTLFILWPAIAALIVGIVLFVIPLGWEMQLVLFTLISGAGLFWGEKYLRPRLGGDEPTDLNDRASRMIGTQVKAVTDFELGRGRVKVADTEWSATIAQGNPKAGDALRILSVSGASVTVESI